jgi:4'-phosphopantetheinyl transferase
MIPQAQPAPAQRLAPRRIELWCAWLADIDAADLWGRYRGLLSADEHARQGRLRAAADRRRDLAARALVRTVLSGYAPVPPEAWVFGADAHGRPRIAAPAVPLEFNLTHSGALVVVGIASGNPVGVDVEHVARATNTLPLERYFSPAEVEPMQTMDTVLRRARFFELWTLKESYLKARGMGLRQPLRTLTFDLTRPGSVRLSLEPDCADTAARWAFAQFMLREEYVLALCAERAGPQPLQLAVHEVVPLASARRLEPHVLRATGIEVAP